MKLSKLQFSRDTVADAVDTVLFDSNKEGDKGDPTKSKKSKKKVVNEIDELNEAMFALFKEQQTSSGKKDRVKFKAQE